MRALWAGLLLWGTLGWATPAQNPHRNLQMACDQCHTESGWRPLRQPLAFDHGRTGFPLQGAHRTLTCTRCHDIRDFQQTRSDCATCHKDPHEGSMGHRCARCHDPQSWEVRDLQRVHRQTTFSFVGAHARLDCETCHRPGAPRAFATLHTQCYACHAPLYASVPDPDHRALQFPLQCELCHGMMAWRPASFRQHDRLYFPIYSGSHAGTWSSCGQCHPDAGNYTTFTCLTCHTESTTRAQHGEVSGFVYDSQACLRCHPTGSGEGEGGD